MPQSQEQALAHEFHDDLAKVGPLVKAVWTLVAVAFVFGGWVTSLQFQVMADKESVERLVKWRDGQAVDMSTLIERVNTIRDDVKELKARWVK